MLISLNKIKEYVQIPSEVSDEELIQLIGARLVEVEQVIDLEPKYRGIFVAKVISAEPIPETHLHLCQIDAGEAGAKFLANNVSPEDGVNTANAQTIQVVCGAPNVRSGMLVAWIAPGAIVPSTFGNEDFRLSVRKLRGYDSNGMLAALDELDLGDGHDGIIEIDPKQTWYTTPSEDGIGSALGLRAVKPGDNLADVFGLNDKILDVENKSLTHRPDCFGLIGFAREVAGILGLEFNNPEWPLLSTEQELPLTVEISDPNLCARYSAAAFDLGNNQPNKYLTHDMVLLSKSGMRSVDPMVDLTNILMLETGQPLHAFDYDKLVAVGNVKTPKIIVRAAEKGETLQLLDGKTIECSEDDILVTSNNVPIALAGAMGGKNTEVDASTKRVILESATFSLYKLRKTQMAHGIFSEAITRFTKGQPAPQTWPVLAESIRRLGVAPLATVDEYPESYQATTIDILVSDINNLLGTNYDTAVIKQTLENVGFVVEVSGNGLGITVPYWRTDIHIKEDIIEEVGRLLGYDNIRLDLPLRPFRQAEIDPILRFKSEIRDCLADNLGMNEVLTYSFVSDALLEKVNLDPVNSYKIVNSISPELQRFRQQITPSLLDKMRENIKAGHRHFGTFEMNQVTSKDNGLDSDNTPKMQTNLGMVLTGDFYEMKSKVLEMYDLLKLPLEYSALKLRSVEAEKYPYFEPVHSAEILLNGEVIGAFGEIKRPVLVKFKLDTLLAPVVEFIEPGQKTDSKITAISAMELRLDELSCIPKTLTKGHKVSKYPSVERDITLTVSRDIEFGRVLISLENALNEERLISTVTPISIYQATKGSEAKNLSFHLRFSSPQGTLTAENIADIMKNVEIYVSKIGAKIV